MSEQRQTPGKFLTIVVILAGGLLLLSGLVATMGYLGLPLLSEGGDILTAQLGQMAAITLGIGGGGLALFHGLNALAKRSSRPMRLPAAFFFGLVFAVVLGLGNVLLNFEVAVELLFPPLFVAGAVLPTLAVVAWAGRRLGWPISWRRASLLLVAGGTISILVAIVLETLLPFFIYLLVNPLEFMATGIDDVLASGTPGVLERFFVSPMIAVFLVVTALQAPIPEEFAKVLGVLAIRRRIGNERQAFLAGMVSGAGFAILENMLYEGLYAQWSGWSWGGVTLLRGIGAVLHPLCTAIVALAIFRERERGTGWFGRLARAYLLSVGLHTLWNGGFETLVGVTGIGYYGGPETTVNIYGEQVAVLLIVFLVLLSLGLWWFMRNMINNLAGDVEPILSPLTISRRAIALWAFASALVIIPIGSALNQAWGGIAAAIR